jgi:phosphoribosylglycinamide formyltransferase-1
LRSEHEEIVILISGRGSNMEAIVRAQIPGARIAAVIANRPDAAGLVCRPPWHRTQVVDHKAYPSRGGLRRGPGRAIDAHRPTWWCWPVSCAC